jgi:predicted phage terminase large subunit-like protein
MPGGTATYTGTFYKFGDTYSHMLNQGVELRVRPCYEITRLEKDDILGSVTRLEVDTDSPVLFSKQYLDELEKTMSPGTWATQYICDPSAAADRGFSQEWILYYSGYPHEEAKGKNIYFLVDAANSKKKDSSYTVMLVIGLGADKNFYLLDGVRDRLNLEERTKTLFRLHRAWEPLDVRYERYGIMADIPHIQHVQQQEGYRFRITEVSGTTSKDDRIERLIPLFSAGRFFLPRELRRTRVDGTRYDLVKEFIDHEFTKWPSCDTKDMLDAMARIQEPNMSLVWPKPKKDEDEYYQYSTSQYAPSWMVA